MTSPPIVHGLDAAEISALVNHRVVDEHVHEAAFLWSQRERAVTAPQYTLKHLARLDERVRAHLAGVQLAGETGWHSALRRLGDGTPEAVFVAGYAAFAARHPDWMQHVLELAGARDDWLGALSRVMGWLSPRHLAPALAILARSPVAEHRLLCCDALCSHRATDPAMSTWLDDADPRVRARALRGVGELKWQSHAGRAADALQDDDPRCRFWAAWSIALMGNPDAARQAFVEGCMLPGLGREAIEIAMRCGDETWARATVRDLAAGESTRRHAIHAAGALGDPGTLRWLLDHCDEPRHARVAGEAIATITGADLVYLDLDRDAPDEAPDGPDEDSELPWPDAAALSRWWQLQAPRYAPGRRHFGGAPVSLAGAVGVLRDGFQRARRSAAVEVARLHAPSPVFPVAACADVQAARLRP